jgi:ketosteroid isomerase-like protein
MSQENVELVRRGYEALARGDFDALFQVLDPDVEMRDAANFPKRACTKAIGGCWTS